jgi:hypothetical protein
MERLLYTIDEWFCFKSGESRLMLAVKAVLGLVWFLVTYVIRFCINLLIEPQINPIKHFPVVTVSHKLLFAFILPLRDLLALTMDRALALTVATAIIWSIPGIFGFLVWELKENWRLYRANRSATLKPVLIGSHGETMSRLLRPGFHSGTIPKLFAKLRSAERRRRRRAARRLLESLHHVETSIRHFAEREFVELLRQSKALAHSPLEMSKVHLATNRVRLEFNCPQEQGPLVILLDLQSGWLVARTQRPAWLEEFAPGARRALDTALAGLYKLAGVDLVAAQIQAALAPAGLSCVVTGAGIAVWSGGRGGDEATYPLSDGQVLPPRSLGRLAAELPVLTAERVLFRAVPITWEEWVEAWED